MALIKCATSGIAKHMATASVARDIVEIVERHGEWRANEANRLVKLAHADKDLKLVFTHFTQ